MAVANTEPNVVLNLLEYRIGCYTTQHFMLLMEIKDTLFTRGTDLIHAPFHRIILRSNRMAAYMKAENYFDRIGLLGFGSYGSVALVKSKTTDKYYALKTVLVRGRQNLTKYLTLAHIERDCAVVCDNNRFVKLKGAWIESNRSPRADCFQFLWENMPYGDLYNIIEQLHPMTSLREDFDNQHFKQRFFNFHNGTAESMCDINYFHDEYNVPDMWFAALFAERRILYEGGKRNVLRQACLIYLNQLMEAIDFLHSQNICHHDLKPANILVAGDLSLRVADLGLASIFNPKHYPHQHEWGEPDYDFTTNEKAKKREIFGGATLLNTHLKTQLAKRTRLRVAGTIIYLGPEHGAPFYEINTSATFSPILARKTDWYAVGVILFELLTGLHPITSTLNIFIDEILADYKHKTLEEQIEYVKIYPQQHNPFLYKKAAWTREAFEHLFLDMRIHRIITKLMNPNPRLRMDFHTLRSDADYQRLMAEPYANLPLIFTWNAFRRQPKECRFEAKKKAYRDQGPPNERPPPAEWSQIFAQPGFPIMTDSPGTIASP